MSALSIHTQAITNRPLSKMFEAARLAVDFSRAEKDVLAQQNLLVADGNKQVTSVHYTYTTGPDGKKYITGAIVKTREVPDDSDAIINDSKSAPSQDKLTQAEQERVRLLEEIDSDVRAHENAHRVAGGAYASAPVFEYEIGPDGRKYAVAGKVRISMPSTTDPELAAEYAKRLYSAAVAPAGGLSSQDIAVAHKAINKVSRNQAISKKSVEQYMKSADKYGGAESLSNDKKELNRTLFDVMDFRLSPLNNDREQAFDRFL